jgi:mannose-6-phosphate isomerase
MNFNFAPSASKEDVFKQVSDFLVASGFTIVDQDFNRPWGGYFVIDEDQARRFSHIFFPTKEVVLSQMVGKLSPKILMVQPAKRLSWQYHFRRSEIWKLVAGRAGVVTSMTDEEKDVEELQVNKVIELPQGQRHRLVGLEGSWGMIA